VGDFGQKNGVRFTVKKLKAIRQVTQRESLDKASVSGREVNNKKKRTEKIKDRSEKSSSGSMVPKETGRHRNFCICVLEGRKGKGGESKTTCGEKT